MPTSRRLDSDERNVDLLSWLSAVADGSLTHGWRPGRRDRPLAAISTEFGDSIQMQVARSTLCCAVGVTKNNSPTEPRMPTQVRAVRAGATMATV